MMRRIPVFAVCVLMACSSVPPDPGYDGDAGIGGGGFALVKCLGGTNGDMDYCRANCQCDVGEGDCDGDDTCLPGLVCAVNAGPDWGLPPGRDVCVSPTCGNNVWDADECGKDCGGTSACPACMPLRPSKTCGAANGDGSYCINPNAPCEVGEGDCDGDGQCAAGLVCHVGRGAAFGLSDPSADVCAASHCFDGVMNGTETGLDCGPDCAPCAPMGGTEFSVGGGDDGAAEAADQHVRGVTSDAAGNIYVTGSFEGETDFGGGALTSAGSDDVFVASYDSSGAHRWSMAAGDTSAFQLGLNVQIDSAGDVVVAGYFQGTINFGGSDLTSAGQQDVFVVKLSASDGSHVWSTSFGGTQHEQALSLAIDGSDNIYVSGSYRGSPDFGDGALPTSATRTNVLVFSVNSSGALRWSAGFGTDGVDDIGRDIAADSSGNIYVTGSYQGAIDFGGGSIANTDAYDAFLASFSSAGAHRWSQGMSGSDEERGRGVAVEGSELVATGWFRGTIATGCKTETSLGDRDVWVARYNTSNGSCVWSRRLGGTSAALAFDVAVEPTSGDAMVTGNYEGTANFGIGNHTSAGERDVFLVYLSASGSPIRSRSFGKPQRQVALSVEAHPNGNTLVGGWFFNKIRFNPSPTLTSDGEVDYFLASIEP